MLFYLPIYLSIYLSIYINKPTRSEKSLAAAIDHIIKDYVLTCDFKTAILKTELADHIPIVIALKNDKPSQQHSKSKHLYKRSYNEKNIIAFNHRLLLINLDEIKTCDDPNEAYKQFLIYLTQVMIYIFQML